MSIRVVPTIFHCQSPDKESRKQCQAIGQFMIVGEDWKDGNGTVISVHCGRHLDSEFAKLTAQNGNL